jgi:MoaA/NifB/PqqE/SkfB family radical SAM enzyme
MRIPFIQVDFEVTNRCNAKCYFCPRDATPHQGLMSVEIFEQSLVRAIELRERTLPELDADLHIALCGLGEPLLNREVVSFVRRVREEGFYCSLSTNGALLDEARSEALLEAGLQQIDINVGEEGDDYEEIYKLPFQKTHDNVVRFAEMAGGRCKTQVVLVNHRNESAHMGKMIQFWRDRGIEHFLPFSVMNRGGALFVDHMQYETFTELDEARSLFEARGEVPVCAAPFVFLFIGYDGQYYLCCSDWKKEAPMGSVFERSFNEVIGPKLQHVLSREPVCKTCNHDPLNRMAEVMRDAKSGAADQAQVDAVMEDISANDLHARRIVEVLAGPDAASAAAAAVRSGRRMIPVSAE